MPRIVFDGSEATRKKLERLAQELGISKIKALRLAVTTLAKLSQEVGKGTEMVLRKVGKKEVGLWIPHLRQQPIGSPKSRK